MAPNLIDLRVWYVVFPHFHIYPCDLRIIIRLQGKKDFPYL